MTLEHTLERLETHFEVLTDAEKMMVRYIRDRVRLHFRQEVENGGLREQLDSTIRFFPPDKKEILNMAEKLAIGHIVLEGYKRELRSLQPIAETILKQHEEVLPF